MSNRPTGVTVLAVLALLGGLLNLFLGGFETLLGPQIGEEMVRQTGDASAAATGGAMAMMGVGILVVGVVQLINAYGLFTLKSWAWMLAVVLQVISLVMNGLQLGGPQKAGIVIAMLISVGVLYYLFRPHVKQAFGRS